MILKCCNGPVYSLALVERAPGRVVAVEELSVEQLHCDDSKYDLQQEADNFRHFIISLGHSLT